MKTEIPPKPEKPTPEECCGSGCNPCIYDYYYRELEKWEEKYLPAIKEVTKKEESK